MLQPPNPPPPDRSTRRGYDLHDYGAETNADAWLAATEYLVDGSRPATDTSERAFLASVIGGEPIRTALAHLSTPKLVEEAAFWRNLADNLDLPDWLVDEARDWLLIADSLLQLRRQRSARYARGDSPIKTFVNSVTVSEVLAQEWGIAARPGRTVKCVAHDDRSPSLSVLADDRRVYCHAAGCVLNGKGHGADAWDLYRLARGREAA